VLLLALIVGWWECCRAESCWNRGGRVGEHNTTVIVREEVGGGTPSCLELELSHTMYCTSTSRMFLSRECSPSVHYYSSSTPTPGKGCFQCFPTEWNQIQAFRWWRQSKTPHTTVAIIILVYVVRPSCLCHTRRPGCVVASPFQRTSLSTLPARRVEPVT